MNTQFRASFTGDLQNIKNKRVLNRIRETIEHVEEAQGPQEMINLKKLRGRTKYFRVRVGEY